MRRRRGVDSVYLGCKRFSCVIPVTAMEFEEVRIWDELGARVLALQKGSGCEHLNVMRT